MNEKIRKMEEENKLIEQGLEHIQFDEWEIDETEKMSLKVRFIQFGNFIIEKLKEAKKMSKELKQGFVHIVINLEVFIELMKHKTIHYEVPNPLPKDAQLIHFEYNNESKEIHLYFTSEKGYPLKEGQLLSVIPVTDIRLKEVRENE